MYQLRKQRKTKPLKANKCEDCEYAIFDETWGEYKCKARMHRISDPARYSTCRLHKKKAVKKEKE